VHPNASLDLPLHYENLRKQLNSETARKFQEDGYAIFYDIYD